MGVFGVGIFSDDDAADIRSDFRDLLGDGLSPSDATDRILKEYRDSEESVVWLALAAVQWKYGRLEDRVKRKALQTIENGSDLRRWQDDAPELIPKRHKVLEKLRDKLLAKQPPPVKIKKRTKSTCEWPIGQVIAYKLLSNETALFRLVAHHTDRGGTYPAFELLDWKESEQPSVSVLSDLPRREANRVKQGNWGQSIFTIGPRRQVPANRVTELGVAQNIKQPFNLNGTTFLTWKHLDRFLEEEYGLS